MPAADSNGNVVISGGSLSVGSGGIGRIFTGSIANSTGVAAVGTGHLRYDSDTNGNTGYTTALTSGINAIYREQPVVMVTASASGSGRTYDGTTTTATLSATGLVNGDTADANVGTVGVTGAGSALKNAGTYTVGAVNLDSDGALSGLGYAVQAGPSSSYTITRATLTVSGVVAASKVYDGTTTASLTNAGTLNGLVGGETLMLTNGGASFADKNAGTGKTVTVTGLTVSDGNGGGNYTVSLVTARGTITPATLNASLTGTVSKTFDGTNAASLTAANYLLSGTLFGGDAVSLNDPRTGVFADATVGTGKTVTVSGLALDNGNYIGARSRSGRTCPTRSRISAW